MGYVVKLDCASVILDFNDKSGAAAGQPFTIFKEGEELKHPVTGKSLGRMEIPVAEGSLREVLPNYSIGVVAPAAQPVAVGMRARLKPVVAAPAPAPVIAPHQEVGSLATARAPLWRSPAFDYQATAFAVADCRGDGKLEAVVSDGRQVYLYPYPPQDAKPLAEFAPSSSAPMVVSLQAVDLNGNGRAEIFVSLYNDAFARFETVVLELDDKGTLQQIAEIPYLVSGYQDPAGKRQFAAQQITDDVSFPFGAIYPLVYKDGKYGPGKPAVKFLKRQVDWLYDFTFLTLDGKPATVSATSTDLIRVQFAKGNSWKTAEAYCQTPIRKRWAGDRMLLFRPALSVVYDQKSGADLYAVKNIASFGGLAGPFGLFSRAELHRLDWNGLSLAPSWVAELGGYSTSLVAVSPPGGTTELAVMVVGAAGKSSIWTFAP